MRLIKIASQTFSASGTLKAPVIERRAIAGNRPCNAHLQSWLAARSHCSKPARYRLLQAADAADDPAFASGRAGHLPTIPPKPPDIQRKSSDRSEAHTSELQSPTPISHADFRLH